LNLNVNARPDFVPGKTNRPEFWSIRRSKGLPTFLKNEINDCTSVSVSVPSPFAMSSVLKTAKKNVARELFRKVA